MHTPRMMHFQVAPGSMTLWLCLILAYLTLSTWGIVFHKHIQFPVGQWVYSACILFASEKSALWFLHLVAHGSEFTLVNSYVQWYVFVLLDFTWCKGCNICFICTMLIFDLRFWEYLHVIKLHDRLSTMFLCKSQLPVYKYKILY